MNTIFEHLQKNAEEYTVQVSHLELYNEALSDLLTSSDRDDGLRIYEEAVKGTYVSALSETVVEKEEDIFAVSLPAVPRTSQLCLYTRESVSVSEREDWRERRQRGRLNETRRGHHFST